MKQEQGITTIFFDAGGVLFDTEIHRDERIRKVLRARGYDDSLIEMGLAKGQEFSEGFLKSGKWLSCWEEEEKFWDGYYEAVIMEIQKDFTYSLKRQLLHQTHYAINCRLFEEVREVLDSLHGSYRLGVISNAYPSMDWVFDMLDIRKYFESITISAFAGVNKPKPGIYELALKSLGVSAGECIFIDDKLENIKAANELGLKGLHLDRKINDLRALINANIEDLDMEFKCV